MSGKVTIKDRTKNIHKAAKGIVDYVAGCKAISQDPTWKGSIAKLNGVLGKLSEIAGNINSAEDIHYPDYIGILIEGEKMVIEANKYVRSAFKDTLLKKKAKRKKKIEWVSNLVTSYASLLYYITDPKELPKIDLEMLFGENDDVLKFADNVWGKSPLVKSSVFFDMYKASEYGKKYPLKRSGKDDAYAEVDMASPILFASVLGPYADLKKLKKCEEHIYWYNESEVEKPRVQEYKVEDDSKYFYILTKKLEGEKTEDKETEDKKITGDFCLTPENDEVGSRVYLKSLAGTYDQQWTWCIDEAPDGKGKLMSIINRKTRLALDVNGCKPPEDRNVAPLLMQEPDGYESQNWLIAPDGHIFYHSPGPEMGYAMDLDGTGKGILERCVCVYRLLPKGSPNYFNQIWEIVPVPFGIKQTSK